MRATPTIPPAHLFIIVSRRVPRKQSSNAFANSAFRRPRWKLIFRDPANVPILFDQAEAALGPVQVLVNNAAYWEPDTFLPSGTELSNKLTELFSDRPPALTAASIDRVFGVNTRAAALTMAEFARRHIDRAANWGRIINVSTAGAERFPSEVTYGASKFALESYTRSAASELGKFGVTVNVVSLGPVQTGWISPELERALLPTIPLGRIGKPEDVADVIVFLASHQSGWVTGQRTLRRRRAWNVEAFRLPLLERAPNRPICLAQSCKQNDAQEISSLRAPR